LLCRTVYVTHDQHEALALSDQLIIMNDGWIEQAGTPLEIYTAPNTSFVADFIGGSNLLKGKITGTKGDRHVLVDLDAGAGQLTCSVLPGEKAAAQGAPVTVSFRPERTGIVAQSSVERTAAERKENNKLSGKVEAASFWVNSLNTV
jgi:ABC-type Fe3+/spermidine/putrescine transport system ATPase subunit